MARPLSLLLLAAALAAMPSAAPAQISYRYVEVFGDDPCPAGGNEIVVCARKPPNARYRIPEALRGAPVDQNGPSQSWANRAESIEYVGRSGPQSCSTTGPGGVTGCQIEMIRRARLERQQQAAAPSTTP